MKQSEMIKQLSDEELIRSLTLSQSFFLVLSFIGSVIFFDSMTDWISLFQLNLNEIIYYGMIPSILIVIIDLILMLFLPKIYYDDGGINERIFKSLNFKEIFFICIFIAVSEELLFRGVIQTTFGYIPASIIFALVHVRYLSKPVLLVSVLLISFFIGYLFEVTGNLNVTIFYHFTVDFVLCIILRFKNLGVVDE